MSAPRSALHDGPGRSFGELSAGFFREYFEKIERAVAPLSDEEIWWRPCEQVNAIGNLLLHLRGNLRQWVIGTWADDGHVRQRSQEFAERELRSKAPLLAALRDTVEQCRAIATELDEPALQQQHEIQGYSTDGLGIVYHVVEHMAYHTGQIVGLAKQILDGREELNFYPQHEGE